MHDVLKHRKVAIPPSGGGGKLRLKNHPDPAPGAGEASAISVNCADCCVRSGVYESARTFVYWTIEEAAAFPAYQAHALFPCARLRSGSTILVHSAAGGVGTALLQLGKIAGFRTASVVGASHKKRSPREPSAPIR